jgi:hypothetical protein
MIPPWSLWAPRPRFFQVRSLLLLPLAAPEAAAGGDWKLLGAPNCGIIPQFRNPRGCRKCQRGALKSRQDRCLRSSAVLRGAAEQGACSAPWAWAKAPKPLGHKDLPRAELFRTTFEKSAPLRNNAGNGRWQTRGRGSAGTGARVPAQVHRHAACASAPPVLETVSARLPNSGRPGPAGCLSVCIVLPDFGRGE